MWAALGNLLKNKLKKTALNAAKGDESSQKKILIMLTSGITSFIIPFLAIIIIIVGPILMVKEYVENSASVTFFEKVHNVLNNRGWCTDNDGSCEKQAEQRFYEEISEVNEKYNKKNIEIDTQLITGTIFYGRMDNNYLYELDNNGHNQAFIKYYCDAYSMGWVGEKTCQLFVEENYDKIYEKNFDKYLKIASNYENLKKSNCTTNNRVIDPINLGDDIEIPITGFNVIDLTKKEGCEFFLWNFADLSQVVMNNDINEITYREGRSDIETLAEEMVSGGSLSYEKYRKYLVETYIPRRFSMMYINASDKDKEIKKIADEIMLFASKKEQTIQYSYISNICPEICLTNGDCLELEEYVTRVVDGESGGFVDMINNYEEQWKAQAVAARSIALYKSNWCQNPIENSTNVQVALDPDSSRSKHDQIKEAIKETEGKILTYDGEVIAAQYDSFYKGNNYHCDDTYCYATYKKVGVPGLKKPETHEIKTYAKWQNILAGGHGNGMSQYGAAYLADTGWKYEEILKYFYSDKVEISYIGGNTTFASGEFVDELLFPLGVNSKTGSCVSAGNYYFGGKYHGSVDIAGNMMGYSFPPNEIPVIASIGGKITQLRNDQWCTDVKYTNGDSRLPKVKGCLGNNITFVVTDPSSKYYNYKFIYYHFDSIDPKLKVGDTIEKGQFLGYMGSTGNSTGYHLHYRIKNPSGGDLNNTPVPDYLTNLLKSYCKNNVGG